MPNPMFVRVSTEVRGPFPVTSSDRHTRHSTGERGSCPNSSHPKKMHVGTATHRAEKTVTFASGQKAKSYVDTCHCEHCHHFWDQEWCWAF